MSDEELKLRFGVEETMQMLEVRELMKVQLPPEEYELQMRIQKAKIQNVLDVVPGIMPIEVAELIVDQLDDDRALDDTIREVLKAIVVIAAFDMQ